MSNCYTEERIYAIDKNNELHYLAMKYFASLGCVYHMFVYANDKHYEVFSTIDDDCNTEITGEIIEIPEVEDWQEVLNGHSNSKAMNLLELHKLNPNFITAIITVSVEGSCNGPYDYYAQVICKNSVHNIEGIVDELFDKDVPEEDEKWHLSANIVANNILNDIECFR